LVRYLDRCTRRPLAELIRGGPFGVSGHKSGLRLPLFLPNAGECGCGRGTQRTGRRCRRHVERVEPEDQGVSNRVQTDLGSTRNDAVATEPVRMCLWPYAAPAIHPDCTREKSRAGPALTWSSASQQAMVSYTSQTPP